MKPIKGLPSPNANAYPTSQKDNPPGRKEPPDREGNEGALNNQHIVGLAFTTHSLLLAVVLKQKATHSLLIGVVLKRKANLRQRKFLHKFRRRDCNTV